MNRLDMAKFLIAEIEEEKKLFATYRDDDKQAVIESKKTGKPYWQFLKYQGRHPSYARIKNNCKKIRQLMLDLSKEEI